MTGSEFARRLAKLDLSAIDRAVALVWLYGRLGEARGVSVGQIARELHEAGYAQQNVSRMRTGLDRDRRVRRAQSGGYRIDPAAQEKLDLSFVPLLGPVAPVATDSVIPSELAAGSRRYIERVVYQINASYDQTLFDCCAVMCRRLLETLMIEVYEHLGRESEIKDVEGHYRMFSGLLTHVEGDKALHLGRQTIRGLRSFKQLGDQSAHNRRFNATRADIDKVRDDVRLAAEELLHLAGLRK